MFDSVRRLLPLAMAAAMALTLTGQAALAQSDEEIAPAASGINAGTVDGKHAINSTGNKNKRKGRLMAFSAAGYLPNNIIRKAIDADKLDGLDSTAFATIAALQSPIGAVNEADNPVHWNQLQGVPPTIADGVDNGITAMTITQVVGANVALAAAGGTGQGAANCPAGGRAIAGGFTTSSFEINVVSSFRFSATSWIVAARNPTGVAETVTPVAYCVTTTPADAVTVAKKGGFKPATPKRNR